MVYLASQKVGEGYTPGSFLNKITETKLTSPSFNSENSYSYNDGNPNTAYIYGCFNIGGTSNGTVSGVD